jgi:hypothetical protein
MFTQRQRIEGMLCLPRVRHDRLGGPYAARASTLLDDYRKRRSCSGGSNSIGPGQFRHAAKGRLLAHAIHFGQCKLPR